MNGICTPGALIGQAEASCQVLGYLGLLPSIAGFIARPHAPLYSLLLLPGTLLAPPDAPPSAGFWPLPEPPRLYSVQDQVGTAPTSYHPRFAGRAPCSAVSVLTTVTVCTQGPENPHSNSSPARPDPASPLSTPPFFPCTAGHPKPASRAGEDWGKHPVGWWQS